MTVGERIAFKRKEFDMSMEQLGNLLGVGRSAVNKWEKGYTQNIPRNMIMKMSKIFECDPAWLGGYSDEVAIKKGILKPSDDIEKILSDMNQTTEWLEEAIDFYKRLDDAQQANPHAREMVENLIKSYQSVP